MMAKASMFPGEEGTAENQKVAGDFPKTVPLVLDGGMPKIWAWWIEIVQLIVKLINWNMLGQNIPPYKRRYIF